MERGMTMPYRSIEPHRSDGRAEPQVVHFSSGAPSSAYLAFGFSAPEDGFVWMIGPSSRLVLPGPHGAEPLILALVVGCPHSIGAISRHVLAVRVNGRAMGHFVVNRHSLLRIDVTLPPDEANGPMEIAFEHPNFVTNSLLTRSGDSRPLAISLHRLGVVPGWTGPDASLAWLWPGTTATAGLVACTALPDAPPLPCDAVPIRVLLFDKDREGAACLGSGWDHDESGKAFTTATESRISVAAPDLRCDLLLRLLLKPIVIRHLMPQQRLTVVVNDAVVAQVALSVETEIVVPVPWEILVDRPSFDVVLVTPNAIPLAQFDTQMPFPVAGFRLDQISLEPPPRHLADLARRRTDGQATGAASLGRRAELRTTPLEKLPEELARSLSMSDAELMRQFESLGDNCAFGLAQRKVGLEVLGLLRFANTPLVALARALADGFAAIQQRDRIEVALNVIGDPPEFMVHLRRYGVRWHTMIHQGEAELEDVAQEQRDKLVYLRRRFVAGLAASRKIYVYGRFDPIKIDIVAPGFGGELRFEEQAPPLQLCEAASLLAHLNRQGRNTLLYVVPSTPDHPSGSADLVMPGLIRGHLDTFVISAETRVRDHRDWVRLCVNAWLLDSGPNRGFREDLSP